MAMWKGLMSFMLGTLRGDGDRFGHQFVG